MHRFHPEDAERRRLDAIVGALDPKGAPQAAFVLRASTAGTGRIGVLAASYNPPHAAHLALAEAARHRLGLAEVIAELSLANVDKEVSGAPIPDRLMMLRLVAEARQWLSVAVTTHGRFLDKLAALSPLVGGAEFVFLVGFDTLVRVFDARYYGNRESELDELFASARFACANRAESGEDELRELLEQPSNRRFAERVEWVPLPERYADVSSTQARSEVAERRGSWIIPEEVAEYVERRRLYR